MKTANNDLAPLPDDRAVLAAVETIVGKNRESRSITRQYRGATANAVAHLLRVDGSRRAGNGAVKGSWSGTMSGSLRISPRLRALSERGVLERSYDGDSYRYEYFPRGER